MTCWAALFVSIAIFMVYHRAFHRWYPGLNPVGHCENQLHGKGFRFLSTLAFAPFFLVVFISPFFLEYQKSEHEVYRKVSGEYHKVMWATWDDSATLNVPLGEMQPREELVVRTECGERIREATFGIGFRYDPDPRVFEKVFRAGGYDSGHNFGSPKVKRFIFGFMIRNEDEIKKLMTSVDFASPNYQTEFKRKMNGLVEAHLQHPGMSFSVFWADIREF